MKQLVQILLPITGKDKEPFPTSHYQQVRRELTKRFGGITTYMRAPAEGLWKDSGKTIEHDDIVIFEVMIEQLDEHWWSNYKSSLSTLFEQDELIIRAQDIRLL